MTITLRCRFFLNIQLMRMVVFYVLLAAASETEIRFSSTRLGFAAHEVGIFRKQCKIKNFVFSVTQCNQNVLGVKFGVLMK